METEKKILITGASGLLGSHLSKLFCEKEKHVFCLVREGSLPNFIHDLPATFLVGDIRDPDRMEDVTRGMDTVIHTAGKVMDWGNYRDFYRTNVTGTINIMNACLKNRVRQVIITGSVSSYGEEDSKVLKDETFPFRSNYPYALNRIFPSGMNNYRNTKAEATRQAMKLAEKNGMNLIVIEPVWIFGENEFRSGFYEYMKTIKSGMPVMPGSRSNTFHVVYAGELARAYYLAFQKELPGVHRIIIGNENPDNMSHIYEFFCNEAGLKKPGNLPKWIIYPPALLMEIIYMALGISKPPVLTRSRVNLFYDSIGFSTKKAEDLIGFKNQVDLETGIKRTVQWYLNNKLL